MQIFNHLVGDQLQGGSSNIIDGVTHWMGKGASHEVAAA